MPGTSYRDPFSHRGACTPCPSAPAATLFGYVAATAAVAAVVFGSQLLAAPLLSLGLVIEFLQLLSVLGLMDLDWPRWLTGMLFPLASAAAGNLRLGALDCVVTGPWALWGTALLAPLVAVAALVALHAVAAAVSRGALGCCRRRHSRSLGPVASGLLLFKSPLRVDAAPWTGVLLNAGLALLTACYLFCVRVALQPLTCVSLLGQWVMAHDTSLPCALRTPGTWRTASVAAATAAAVAAPLVAFVLLRRHSEAVCGDQALFETRRGASRLSNNPHHLVRAQLSSLYAFATPSCYLWTLAVMGRKLGAVLAVSLLHHRQQASVNLVVGVLLLALAVQATLQPYATVAAPPPTHAATAKWRRLYVDLGGGGCGLRFTEDCPLQCRCFPCARCARAVPFPPPPTRPCPPPPVRQGAPHPSVFSWAAACSSTLPPARAPPAPPPFRRRRSRLVVGNPNTQDSVSLVCCVALLLLVPLRGGGATVDALGVSHSTLKRAAGAVVAVGLLWHAAAVVMGLYVAVRRVVVLRSSKADRRPEVRIREGEGGGDRRAWCARAVLGCAHAAACCCCPPPVGRLWLLQERS